MDLQQAYSTSNQTKSIFYVTVTEGLFSSSEEEEDADGYSWWDTWSSNGAGLEACTSIKEKGTYDCTWQASKQTS